MAKYRFVFFQMATEGGCLHAFTATLLCELRKIVTPQNEKNFNRIAKDLHVILNVSSFETDATVAQQNGVNNNMGSIQRRHCSFGTTVRRRRYSTSSLLSGLDGQLTSIDTIKHIMKDRRTHHTPKPADLKKKRPGITSPSSPRGLGSGAAIELPTNEVQGIAASSHPPSSSSHHNRRGGGAPTIIITRGRPKTKSTVTPPGVSSVTAPSAKGDSSSRKGGDSTTPPVTPPAQMPDGTVLDSAHAKKNVAAIHSSTRSPPQIHTATFAGIRVAPAAPLPPMGSNAATAVPDTTAGVVGVSTTTKTLSKPMKQKQKQQQQHLQEEKKHVPPPPSSSLVADDTLSTLENFLHEQRSADGEKEDHPRFVHVPRAGYHHHVYGPPQRLEAGSGGEDASPLSFKELSARRPDEPEEGGSPGTNNSINLLRSPGGGSPAHTRSLMAEASSVEAAFGPDDDVTSKTKHQQAGGSRTPRAVGGLRSLFPKASLIKPSSSPPQRKSRTRFLKRSPSLRFGSRKSAPDLAASSNAGDSSIYSDGSSWRPPAAGGGVMMVAATAAAAADGATAAAAAVEGGGGGRVGAGGGTPQHTKRDIEAPPVPPAKSRWSRLKMAAVLVAGFSGTRGQPGGGAAADVVEDKESGEPEPSGGGGGVKRYVWELPVIVREQLKAVQDSSNPNGGGGGGGGSSGGLQLQTDVLAITNDGRHMLHPQGLFRMTWDILLMLLFIYTLGTQPLRVGFYNDELISANERFWSLMELMIDVWFLSDVGLNFRTGYWDEQTKLVIMNPRDVKRDYLRGWFGTDFVSSVPLWVFLPPDAQGIWSGTLREEVKAKAENEGTSGGLTIISLTSRAKPSAPINITHVLARQLLKLLRLGRVLRSKTTNKLMNHFHIRPSSLRMFKFVVVFIMVLHVVACSYWHTAIEEGMGTTIWLPTEEQGFASLKDKYSVAFHWAVCAILGNYLAPETAREHRFTSLVLTIGIVVFASIVGSASTLLANLNAAAVERRNRLDRINAFLQYRKVSGSLQHKIKDFYEYLWQAGRGSEDEQLFAELPPKLRLQLGLALKEHFIESVPLLKKSTPEFVVALVQRLVPKLATPNEMVVEENTKGYCMFFVNRGSLVVYIGQQGNVRVELSYLQTGSFFGEIALLDRYRKRSASVKATTFCDMQSLGKEDFDDFLGAFPFFRKSIVYAAESRFRMSANIAKMQQGGVNVMAGGGGGRQHAHRSSLASIPTIPETSSTTEGGQLNMMGAVSTVHNLLRVRQQVKKSAVTTTFEQATHLVEAAEKKYLLMQSEVSSSNVDGDSDWWDDDEKSSAATTTPSAVNDSGRSTTVVGSAADNSPALPFDRKIPRVSMTFRGIPDAQKVPVVGGNLSEQQQQDSISDKNGFDALRKRPRSMSSIPRSGSRRKSTVQIG